jgi:hypothetical protein
MSSSRHGRSRSAEYQSWANAIQRCENPNTPNYHLYGGRGITMCERWRSSFENFLADIGERPSAEHSLDRFPDGDGNYGPGNCRWATRSEQNNNGGTFGHPLTINGETRSIARWAAAAGVNRKSLLWRVQAGWPPEQLLAPVRPKACPNTSVGNQPEAV